MPEEKVRQDGVDRNRTFLDVDTDDKEPVVGDTPEVTPVVEDGDTIDDTPVVEETPDDEPVVEESLLVKHGLEKKYTSEDDALAALKAANATISQHQMERQQTDRRLAALEKTREAPVTRPKVDAELLETDPDQALAAAGYVRSDEVSTMVDEGVYYALDNKEAQKFMDSKPDWDTLKPLMDSISQRTPGLRNIPKSVALKFLYGEAQELLGKKPAPEVTKPPVKVEPAPGAEKRKNANTSGGGRVGSEKHTAPGVKGYTVDQINNMSPQEMIEKKVVEFEP